MNFVGQSFLNDRLFTDRSGKERRPRRLLNPMVGQWSPPAPYHWPLYFLTTTLGKIRKIRRQPSSVNGPLETLAGLEIIFFTLPFRLPISIANK